MGIVKFKHVNGHVEVFMDGEFLCTADTMSEAIDEAHSLANTPAQGSHVSICVNEKEG